MCIKLELIKEKFSYFCIFIQTFYTITYIVLSHNRADAKCSLHDIQRHLSTRLTYKSNQTNTLCMHTIHKHTETIRPTCVIRDINPLNPELNPICYLLALLGAPRFLHVSRIRVKLLTFRLLMSYIYGAPILDVSRSHTTTQHSR